MISAAVIDLHRADWAARVRGRRGILYQLAKPQAPAVGAIYVVCLARRFITSDYRPSIWSSRNARTHTTAVAHTLAHLIPLSYN